MEQVLQHVAQTVEKQLDSELEKLDAMDSNDLEAIRRQRIEEMKKRAKLKQEWLANYSGDLLVPPAEARRQRALTVHSKKTIRDKQDSDSDLDFSD
ncbi:Thioredoxin domain-containing protein 9 [Papilio machaon]|uniref:Thioredoxin domain-containing protein 9 n=1 Tax=Papilio machaon TaxID=76193 RepID=A0A0N1I9D6_PAPMA|nr:Thioredoxin domain-containing protein 9 [Papilio machaon]